MKLLDEITKVLKEHSEENIHMYDSALAVIADSIANLVVQTECYDRGLALNVEFKAEITEFPELFDELLLSSAEISLGYDKREVLLHFKDSVLSVDYSKIKSILKNIADECIKSGLRSDLRVIEYHVIDYQSDTDITRFDYDTWVLLDGVGFPWVDIKNGVVPFCNVKGRKVLDIEDTIYADWIETGFDIQSWGADYNMIIFGDYYDEYLPAEVLDNLKSNVILAYKLDHLDISEVIKSMAKLAKMDLVHKNIKLYFMGDESVAVTDQEYIELSDYSKLLEKNGVKCLNFYIFYPSEL